MGSKGTKIVGYPRFQSLEISQDSKLKVIFTTFPRYSKGNFSTKYMVLEMI